ncbi:metal-dependent hydrolase [Patescibacteria group bacterium]
MGIILIKFLNPDFINPNIILSSIMIGYISHLIADSFTKKGLPFLYPIKLNFGFPPVKKFRIKTGKFVENFLVFPLAWVYLITIIYFNQDKLIKIINLIQ